MSAASDAGSATVTVSPECRGTPSGSIPGTGTDLLTSGRELVHGLVLATVVGLPLGLVMGCYTRLSYVLSPLVTLGHTSARVPGTDRVVVKPKHSPSVRSMAGLGPDAMVVVDLDGRLVAGDARPPPRSSSTPRSTGPGRRRGGGAHPPARGDARRGAGAGDRTGPARARHLRRAEPADLAAPRPRRLPGAGPRSRRRARIEDKSRLGRVRWVVERAISWLLRFNASGCATTGPNAPRWRYSPWPAP